MNTTDDQWLEPVLRLRAAPRNAAPKAQAVFAVTNGQVQKLSQGLTL
jgi:hypothetical protein